MKRQTEHWLDSAEDDLAVIENIMDNEHLTHMVAFHSRKNVTIWRFGMYMKWAEKKLSVNGYLLGVKDKA